MIEHRQRDSHAERRRVCGIGIGIGLGIFPGGAGGGASGGGAVAFTYYVDPAGSDAAAGTLAAPWQTIAKVNAATLTPGQSVGFKRGGVWRETLTPGQSGSAGLPITFGAYGVGAKPVISGADLQTGWSAVTAATPTSSDGFELGDADLSGGDGAYWAGGAKGATGALVGNSTTVVDSGTYAAKLTWSAAGDFAYARSTTTAVDEAYMQFRIYVASLTGSAGGFVNLRSGLVLNTGGIAVANPRIKYLTSSTFNLDLEYANTTGSFFISGATVLSTGQWYTIELHYKKHATLGGAELWINGVLESSILNTNTSSRQTDQLRIGMTTATANVTAGTIYFDNVKWHTAPIGIGPANVYSKTLATQPKQVFFDGSRGQLKTSALALTTARDWYWAANVLYAYSASAPSSAYTNPGIEASVRNNAVNIASKSYITVDGLNPTKANNRNVIIGGATTMTGVTMQNSLLDYSVGANLVVDPTAVTLSSDILIQRNEFTASLGEPGILNVGGADLNGKYVNRTLIFQDNDIHDNAFTGVESDQFSSGCIIRRNRIWNNGIGIVLDNASGNTIAYNSIWSNGASINGTGIVIYSETAEVSTDNIVVHNTIYGNHGGGIHVQDSLTNSVIKNNILVSNGTYYPELNFKNGLTLTGLSVDKNIYYTTSGNALFWVGDDNPLSFAAWKVANTPWDAASINADPLFTNAAAGDFTLQPSSPALASGVFIAGVSAANPPNIGAK